MRSGLWSKVRPQLPLRGWWDWIGAIPEQDVSLANLCIYSVIKHGGGKHTYKAASVNATYGATAQKDKWSIVENGAPKKKKSHVPLSDLECLRKSVLFESCYPKAKPPHTANSWARARLQLVAMSGTVLDGCTSFYLLTTGALLFPCRWPIHSLLPLTLSFFLPLNGQRRPPGSIQRQWTASNQQNI